MQLCNVSCMYDVVLSKGGGGVGAWNAAAAASHGSILLQVTMLLCMCARNGSDGFVAAVERRLGADQWVG
jgi:hypothetical protein